MLIRTGRIRRGRHLLEHGLAGHAVVHAQQGHGRVLALARLGRGSLALGLGEADQVSRVHGLLLRPRRRLLKQ